MHLQLGVARVQSHMEVVSRVVLAFVLALAGGVISAVAAISHRRLCDMISFAAGTLLGVTLFSLLPEIAQNLAVPHVLIGLGSGYLVFMLISRYVFHVCPACAASHFDEATTHRFNEIASAMIIALGLHSTLDGIAVVLGEGPEMTSGFEFSLLVAICVHKVPEGLALCALLLAAGLPRGTALLWVAAVESTTLLGGAIGLWFAPQGIWLDLILAHVGGGFVFLAIHAVFGELSKHNSKRVYASFGAGILLIAALDLALHHYLQ